MDAARVADVLGSLATVAAVGALLLGVAQLVGRVGHVDDVARWVRTTFGGLGWHLAAGVAAVCVAGSLYFSEVAGFPPCELCWYQRIAMYPLVVVLGVGAVRRRRGARDTDALRSVVLLLAGLGLLVAGYHVVVELRPALETSCDPAAPCSVRWVEGLGFWTIPRMAAAGFAAVLALTTADRADPHPEAPTASAPVRR